MGAEKMTHKTKRKGLSGFNSRTHPRMLDARERQDYALQLRLMGNEYQAIANAGWPLNHDGSPMVDETGLPLGRLYASRGAAHKAVCRALQLQQQEKSAIFEELVAINERRAWEERAELYMATEQLRLLLRPAMEQALAGDIAAGNMSLKIIKHRGVVLGYLPNPKRHYRSPKRTPNEGLAGMLRRMKEIKAQREAALATSSQG